MSGASPRDCSIFIWSGENIPVDGAEGGAVGPFIAVGAGAGGAGAGGAGAGGAGAGGAGAGGAGAGVGGLGAALIICWLKLPAPAGGWAVGGAGAITLWFGS
jgi:hypothetical protein